MVTRPVPTFSLSLTRHPWFVGQPFMYPVHQLCQCLIVIRCHTSKLQQTSTNPSRQKLEIVDAKAILLLNTPTCVCVCTKTPSAWQVTPTSPISAWCPNCPIPTVLQAATQGNAKNSTGNKPVAVAAHQSTPKPCTTHENHETTAL